AWQEMERAAGITTFHPILSDISSLPGRHVAEVTYPGGLVARDKLKGKTR
ncbi:hypothetical protein Tco_0301221, partial [Tanacetum coccineum]